MSSCDHGNEPTGSIKHFSEGLSCVGLVLGLLILLYITLSYVERGSGYMILVPSTKLQG